MLINFAKVPALKRLTWMAFTSLEDNIGEGRCRKRRNFSNKLIFGWQAGWDNTCEIQIGHSASVSALPFASSSRKKVFSTFPGSNAISITGDATILQPMCWQLKSPTQRLQNTRMAHGVSRKVKVCRGK